MFSKALVILGAIAFSMAQKPSCYPKGNGDSKICKRMIGVFCETVSHFPIGGNNRVSRCFVEGDYRCDFNVISAAAGGAVNPSECSDYLNRVIDSCPSGGYVQPRSGFTFNADFNGGDCGVHVNTGA